MHGSSQKVEETATRIFGNAKYKPNCSSNKQSSKNLFRRHLFPKHTHMSSLLGLGFFTFLKISSGPLFEGFYSITSISPISAEM